MSAETTGTEGAALLAELFDALWLEDVAGFRSRSVLGPPFPDGRRDYALALGAAHLRALVRPDSWRSGIRLAGAVRTESATGSAPLEAPALLASVLSALPDPASAAARTIAPLREVLAGADLRAATAPALEAAALSREPLAFERLAAWRDRPFHPLGRARHGLSRDEMLAYGAEAGRYFPLAWCALARERCAASPSSDPEGPAALLFDPMQRALLGRELAARGLTRSHVAIPLHPWQAAHALAEPFAEEIRSGGLVLLDLLGPLCAATSSLRTVALPARPGLHLKLPLDVQTLGVRRLLPPQSLRNSGHGETLVRAALARDPWLARHVRAADETAFWHFREADGDVYAERGALLGCQIRRFPDEAGIPLPLASLAVAPLGGLPPAVRAVAGDNPDLPALFGTIAELVLGTALRCVALGCVPELHGQNALLLCRDGAPRRLVLRDHDTVRTAPDWLARSGLELPPYLVTDPVRNSLLLRCPEELLAYAQTLAVDVALRAVAEAFAGAGRGFDLGEARSILAGICERVLAEAPMPAERRSLLSGLLLESEVAPFKQVLTPLLAEGRAGTSMPSRLGTAPNPLFVRGLR
ncbi:IucA/IucC family protein [Methylorubrum thiocyanatum]|uniref:IucA/IucC family protein n=1 Tax=Methylorubrum thiocyanatum TaxID=47958 RepID=UPI00398C72FD